MEAPLLVQAEPDLGVPFSHLQLLLCGGGGGGFFSHLVLSELMVYPRSRHGLNGAVRGHSSEFQWRRLQRLLAP